MLIGVSYEEGKVFGCVKGEADEAVQAYLKKCLVDCGTAVCEHHS